MAALPPEPPSVPPVPSPEPAPEEHALGALSPRAMAPQVLTGGVAPFVAYEVARHFAAPDSWALAVSSVPPAVAVLGEWAWRRRLNVVGAIALVGIVAGLVSLTVLHGGELVLKMRESVVTGAFGIVCLVTLAGPWRPAMFYMGRALAGARGPSSTADFDTLWERSEARRAFTVVTAAWGVGLVLEAGMRAVLALEVPTGPFLVVTPILGWSVIGGLLFFTIRYSRMSRARAVAAP
ncbi:MAG TPA: VC0807 family protein [Acidimicrobiales bacterium]|nr:VC0807 family protein [Acidimicrobiales bacterium]